MHRFRTAAVCLALVLTAAACAEPPAVPQSSAPPAAAAPKESPVERGKALVAIGGCHDCHTPKTFGPKGPEPDMSKMLSGHPEALKVTPYKAAPGSPWTAATNDHLTAWSGPWGVSFAANLTPDTNNGLRSGVWTEEIFIKAIRTGKHMGTARDILPPMPWQDISSLSDDDLKAIWAYLGSIPAIANHVPDPLPPAGAQK